MKETTSPFIITPFFNHPLKAGVIAFLPKSWRLSSQTLTPLERREARDASQLLL